MTSLDDLMEKMRANNYRGALFLSSDLYQGLKTEMQNDPKQLVQRLLGWDAVIAMGIPIFEEPHLAPETMFYNPKAGVGMSTRGPVRNDIVGKYVRFSCW